MSQEWWPKKPMEIWAILTDKLKQNEETDIHPGGARSGAGKAIDKDSMLANLQVTAYKSQQKAQELWA